MKPKLLGVLCFIAFGVAKGPLEDGLALSMQARGFQLEPPALDWKENIGQMAIATLGGMRDLAASISYMLGFSAAFDDLDWGMADTLMTLTTRFEPTEPLYWDQASWFMAYNAASHYLHDKNLRYAIKMKLYHDHVQRGIGILEEGLRYNPDQPILLERLGEIYQTREPDSRLAAKYFLAAYQHGASGFFERVAAYEMVKLDDYASSEKAYEILKRHYDTDKRCRSLASVLRDLPILEERLNIPVKDRIHPPTPYVPQVPLGPGTIRPAAPK